MDHLSLLAGAAEHTVEDWESLAAGVLRKAGRLRDDDADSQVWERLTRRRVDGIEVPPLGTPATSAALPAGGLPGQVPFTRGSHASTPAEGWDIRAVFDDPDPEVTAEHVLTDLENGVTSVWLSIGDSGLRLDDLGAVLGEVMLDLAPVVLDAPRSPLEAADAFAAVVAERGVTLADGTNLGVDPIGALVRGLDADVTEQVAGAAERARALGTLALVVDGTAVHDAGASDVQELGYATAVGAAYLRLLTDPDGPGLDVDQACALLEFRYAATDDQFATIAKLRAARRLWHRVAELSGASPEARRQRQHVVTSRPMMSKYDPWVNMLRTTVAAFAAGVGGAGSVTVLPFDAALGLPDAFSRRIARNTSSLLVSESHVARVTDPAGGSHAVEQLTHDTARAAWDELGRIEDAGGALAAVEDGSLLERVAELAGERLAAHSSRRIPITGVSEFPHLGERLPERRPHPEGSVQVRRYGAPFEALRDDPPTRHVFLATMGPIASHTARATFATNLLAAGGVAVDVAGATGSVDGVLEAYDGQRVVCLAGHDRTYDEWGADLVAALREAGAGFVVLAGRPVDGVEVDEIAATGVDALAFLTRVREELGR